MSAARQVRDGGAALSSGFPRQLTGTVGDTLLDPLVHVVLLGWPPLRLMHRSLKPGFGAGCGQIMAVDAAATAPPAATRDLRLLARRPAPAPRLPPRRLRHRYIRCGATGFMPYVQRPRTNLERDDI